MLKSCNHVSSQTLPVPHFFPYLCQQLHHLMSHKLTTWVPFSTPLRFPHKSCRFSSHCRSEIFSFFPTYATIIQSLQFLAAGSMASSLYYYSLPSALKPELISFCSNPLCPPPSETRVRTDGAGRKRNGEHMPCKMLREEEKSLCCEKYNASY